MSFLRTTFIVLFLSTAASAEPIRLNLLCSQYECWAPDEIKSAIREGTDPGHPSNLSETIEGGVKLFLQMMLVDSVDSMYEVNKKGKETVVETGEGKGSFLDMLDGFGDTIKEYIWQEVQAQLDEVEEAGVWVNWQGGYHGFGYNRSTGKWSYFKFLVVEDKDAPPTEQL